MIGEFIELQNEIEMNSGVSISSKIGFDSKKTLSGYKAVVIARNSEICKLEGRIDKRNYETTVNFSDDTYIIKSFDQSNTLETIKATVNVTKDALKNSLASVPTELLPKIYNKTGELIGQYEVLSSGDGVDAYFYHKYTINGVILYAYELSHSADDLLYCVYNEQDQMVATISKNMHVSHGHARYTIYSCNEEWFKYAILITVCWAIKYTNEDGSAGSHVTHAPLLVPVKLLEKYNPTFIEQVTQKEGIHNLPENMPLARELITESKKGPDMKLYKYSIIIIFVVIFVCILLAFLRK